MLGYAVTVAGQAGTLFLLMAVGFGLGKLKWLDDHSVGQLTRLLLYLVTGCVIVRSLQLEFAPELLTALAWTAGAAAVIHLVCALLVPLFFCRSAPAVRAPLEFGGLYGNIGFMGLPLVEAVLGKGALIFAAAFLAVYSLFYWTHGILRMGGREQVTPRRVLLNPGILSVTLGLVLFAAGTKLPPVLGGVVSYLADLNTPLAMLVIGFQMSQADLPGIFRRGDLLLAAFFKLILMPALAALCLLPLHVPAQVFCVVVVLAATPAAGSAVMFARLYGRDSDTAAQLVALSTLLSVASLPIWAAVARILAA